MQAYAAVKFADACLRGLRGDAGVVECAFVASQVFLFLFSVHSVTWICLNRIYCSTPLVPQTVCKIISVSTIAMQVTELPFFASKVRLGRTGVEEICPLGPLNQYERSAEILVICFCHVLFSFGRERSGASFSLLYNNSLTSTGLAWRRQRKSWQQALTREFRLSGTEWARIQKLLSKNAGWAGGLSVVLKPNRFDFSRHMSTTLQW